MVKTIGLTYDLKSDYIPRPSDPVDVIAEFDNEKTLSEISTALVNNGYQVKRIGNVYNLLKALPDLGADLVLNIAEGFQTRNRESQVPMILELYHIPYIGADALTLGLTLDKALTKKILMSEGIPTPRFFNVKDVDELKDTDHVSFPMIVKPRYEGSSKGLTNGSRVEDMESLKDEVLRITKTYKQPALVEEFISGTEFTVPIVGNDPIEVFPPVQIQIDGRLDLGDMFYTFERLSSDKLRYICPARISKELEARLKDAALKTYKAVDCRDLGRVDFRVDKDNNIYVLEINPLPILCKEDAFFFVAEHTKIGYDRIIAKIVESAIKRLQL